MRIRIGRLQAAVLAFLGATALLSCIRANQPRDFRGPPAVPSGPRLNHAIHVDAGLECADCHQVKPEEDGDEAAKDAFVEPGPVPYAVCADCHEEEDAEAAEADKKLPRYFDAEKRPKWTKASWDYAPEILWGHAPHKDVGCAVCHGDMTDRRAGLLFTMDACIACHQQRGAPDACEACHPAITTATVPSSHRHLWRERHGRVARTQLERAEGRCHYCHTDPYYCERCHKEEKPRSHNNLWRLKTHGFAAAMDRASCQVCHTTDYCIRCHQDTQPLSHRGMWARGLNTHCIGCHFPVSSNPECVVCHQTNPTHSTAPDQPATHVPGLNCRLCHNETGGGGAPPLTHYDNGSQCESCHQ